MKYVYVDLPAFQNTLGKFTKESSLNCHKKSFLKFSFLNLFILIQATGQTSCKLTVICIGASLTFVLHSWEPLLLIRQLFLYVSDQTAAKNIS